MRTRIVEATSPGMYQGRYDNDQWFWIDREESRALQSRKSAIIQAAFRKAWTAMGATRVEFRGAKKQAPDLVVFDRPGSAARYQEQPRDALGRWREDGGRRAKLSGRVAYEGTGASRRVGHTTLVGHPDPDSAAMLRLDKQQTTEMRRMDLGGFPPTKASNRAGRDTNPELRSERTPIPGVLRYTRSRLGQEVLEPGLSPRVQVPAAKGATPEDLWDLYAEKTAEIYARRAWALFVASGRKTYPLHGTQGSPGLITSGAGSRRHGIISYRLATAARVPWLDAPVAPTLKAPRILAYGPHGAPCAIYLVSGAGTLAIEGNESVPVLTFTRKMAAPSFSLPAGPTASGGTCTASMLPAEPEYDDKHHVCTQCYAKSSSYTQPAVMLAGAAKLSWVVETLAGDPGGGLLGRMIAASIATYASHSTEASSDRRGEELGLWRGGRIVVPYRGSHRSAFVTKLPIGDTRSWFANRTVPPASGDVVGFFRIHDAGDLSVPGGSAGYVNAWRMAAEILPHVQFWCPTRVWARRIRGSSRLSPQDERWLERVKKWGSVDARTVTGPSVVDVACDDSSLPGAEEGLILATRDFAYVPHRGGLMTEVIKLAARDNVVVRPSTLYVKTAVNPAYVPTVQGLDAGSGVTTTWRSSRREPGAADVVREAARTHDLTDYVPVYDLRGQSAHQCPVYSDVIPVMKGRNPVLDDEGLPEMREAVSCLEAGCRACWVLPDKPVAYGFH